MDEATVLYQIRRTLLELLQDRGYCIPATVLGEKRQEFCLKYQGNGRKTTVADDTTPEADKDALICQDDAMFVFFADEVKVGVRTVRNFASTMEEQKVSRAILVVREGMTNQAERTLRELFVPRLRIEQFSERELLFNITKHDFVPQHQKLSKEEKEELLQRYKIKDSQLPRLATSDPVARYYGLDKGDVVKITRPSETAGQYLNYRLVVG